MAAPQAMVKGIQNTANQFMNNPQKVLQKAFYRLNFISVHVLYSAVVTNLLDKFQG